MRAAHRSVSGWLPDWIVYLVPGWWEDGLNVI